MLFEKNNIGIDLGTANTLIYLEGSGVVLREPSVVAINAKTNKVLAVGQRAKNMVGRTPSAIVAISPLKDGVISDFGMAKNMLEGFLNKLEIKKHLIRPCVLVCMPRGITEVEKRAIEEAVVGAGARDVYLVEEPMAAAIGADLQVEEPIGNMIVDIGGGTSEIAIISLGGIVVCCSLKIAGRELDRNIIGYIKKQYNLLIGENTAEKLKIAIGSVFPYEEEGGMEIRGRDLLTGLAKSQFVEAKEIREAIASSVASIAQGVKSTMEQAPPELLCDIYDTGIVLTGGGSNLRGLDRLVEEATGLRVRKAENVCDCVVNGTGKILEDLKRWRTVLLETKLN